MKRVCAFTAGVAALGAGMADSGSVRASGVGGQRVAVTCTGAVSWQNVGGVVGRTATIIGRVASASYAKSSFGSPTFLDLGAASPSAKRVTVVIWYTHRAAFGQPEVRYRGKTICVRGSITRFQGVAQLEARVASQIRVAG
jgi:hypothetical protein